MKQYNSISLTHAIWGSILLLFTLCLLPNTAEAQLNVGGVITRDALRGALKPTGTATIWFNYGGKGTPPYTIKLTSVPNGFKGETEFTSSSEEPVINNLSAGNYTIEISDVAGNKATKKFVIGEESINLFFPDAHWTQQYTSKEHPDWVATALYTTPKGDGYSFSLDALSEYIEYAICTLDEYNQYEIGPGTLQWITLEDSGTAPTFEGTMGVWRVQEPIYDSKKQLIGTKEKPYLFVKVPEGGLTPNEMYRYPLDPKVIGIAFRPKGVDDPQYSGFTHQYFDGKDSFDPNQWLEYFGGNPDPCGVYIPAFRIKEEVVNDLTFPVTLSARSSEWPYDEMELTFTKEDYMDPKPFKKGLSYGEWNRIYMRDSSGKDSSLGIRPSKTSGGEIYAPAVFYGIYYPDSEIVWDKYKGWLPKPDDGKEGWNYCEGTREAVFAFALDEERWSLAYPVPCTKAEFTLISAPDDYEPQNEYFPKLNVPIHFSDKHPGSKFFPFPNASVPKDNPYAEPCFDVKIPEGKYQFRVKYTALCGEEVVFDLESFDFRYNAKKYELDNEGKDLKPKVVQSDCDNMRVYPFHGTKSRDILKLNDVSVPVYAMIKQRPKNTATYPSGVPTLHHILYDPAEESVKPEELYVEIPWVDSEVEIWYNFEFDSFNRSIPCLDLGYKKIIDTGTPTYDREHFEAYICSSGTSAHISVLPLKTTSGVTVELREMDNETVIATKTRPANDDSPIVFDLTEDQIRPEYYLYIESAVCNLNNGGEKIKLIDLTTPHFVEGLQSPKYCVGSEILLKVPKITSSSVYIWTRPDGSTVEGPTLKIDEATLDHTGNYKLHISDVICEGASTDVDIDFKLIVAPTELWWRKDATSADWNSTDNWADSQGKPITAIPASCTNVHIPGVVDKFFPDLDPAKTMRQSFGEPVCNDIYFHYGAALGNPQLLSSYARAFIDYNFGIMQADGTAKPYEDPQHLEANALLLERDRWYMLSTPIKNVYAGDFSLAGYPLTYQRYLKLLPVNADGSLTEASFDQAISTQGTPIADSNLALALKVVGYQADKIGASDHKNLNGLQGIIRLPFYETNELNGRKEFYPLHRYDPKEWLSLFVYFNERDLKPVSKMDGARRDPVQDYRFVFEDSATKAIGSIADDTAGEATEGYTLKLKKIAEVPQLMALVGNPFMTPISFDKLYEANTNNIEPYYYLFTDGAWHYYHVNAVAPDATYTQLPNGQIAPLQAFVVKVKMGVSQLHFPTTGDQSVLLPPKADGRADYELRSGNSATSLADQRAVSLTVSDVKGAKGFAMLLPEATVSATPALIAPSTMQTAPVAYFVNPTDGSCNFVQTDAPYTSLELGIYAPTDGMLTLDFTTLAEKPFDKLALYDRLRGTEQDLLANPSYSYAYSPRDGRRFELRMSYAGVRSNEEMVNPQDELQIERTATGYRISYDEGIAGYQLYSVHGYLLERATTDGQTQVDIEMPETEVVLLDVQSADGLRWIKKLQR